MRTVACLIVSLLLLACGRDARVAVDPDAGASDCDTPLDDEVLGALRISIEPNLALRPGQARALRLGVVECCSVFDTVDACATWSVSPAELATIGRYTGQLEILDGAGHGDVVTVTADVEDGRGQVDIDVHVYTPEANPLFGIWREAAQLSCADGEEVAYDDRINELLFRADGTFHVTWYPFELYVDYWGRYAYDLEDGALSLEVTGGNHVPEDIDGAGRFRLDEAGRLVLEDLWLGRFQGAEGEPRCGHVFVR
jgi:hypothetical protein